jgi:hypothetical protein
MIVNLFAIWCKKSWLALLLGHVHACMHVCVQYMHASVTYSVQEELAGSSPGTCICMHVCVENMHACMFLCVQYMHASVTYLVQEELAVFSHWDMYMHACMYMFSICMQL